MDATPKKQGRHVLVVSSFAQSLSTLWPRLLHELVAWHPNPEALWGVVSPETNKQTPLKTYSHEKLQVPKMQESWTFSIRLFWAFPWHKLDPYSWYRCGFLYFRYLKCLVILLPVLGRGTSWKTANHVSFWEIDLPYLVELGKEKLKEL